MVLATVVGGGETASKQAGQPDTVGIGEPAEDGQLRFVVRGVETGVESVGDEFTRETPQGEFVVLDVEVTSIGTEPVTLMSSDQYLIDGRGNRHGASVDANLFTEGQELFVSEINPDNTVTGQVVFDVPEGRKIVDAELHDSALSDGVIVNLR